MVTPAHELYEELEEPALLPYTPTLGAPQFTSHLTPDERALSQRLLAEFEQELKAILDLVWTTYEEKGKLYDRATPVWHHFPFGLASFAHSLFLKATRFVSLLQQEQSPPLYEIEDTLKDLLVYASYALAYARISTQGGEE